MDVKIQGPGSFDPLMTDVFVPYCSFWVFLKDEQAHLPITVEIVEKPSPPIDVSNFILRAGKILKLDTAADIYNPYSLHESYSVDKLSSFELNKWPYVSFLVKINTGLSVIQEFKGSTMEINVHNQSGYSESRQIRILNANPNNHFHWANESSFVDGWYFKCVHIDETELSATPFFFLYGVQDPAGGPNSGSFLICANGGTISLDQDFAPAVGERASPPDVQDWRFLASDFKAETFYGLNTKVGTDFLATDRECKGRRDLPSGETISWDLSFTKIHTHCLSDWNPLEPFETYISYVPHAYFKNRTMPLMTYFRSFPLFTAYYMAHNMNSFVSGAIEWKGKIYKLDNCKGYQDENWGSGGFPHPYVFIQSNNFVDPNAIALPDTSLNLFFTPGMPMPNIPGLADSETVGGVCLRDKGKIYKFFSVHPTIFGIKGMADTIAMNVLADVGPMSCEVEFVQDGINKKVDITDVANIKKSIGSFEERHVNSERPHALPIRWTIDAMNSRHAAGQGDEIKIEAECDATTVMMLAAPLGGRMQAEVTKQSLHSKIKVILTPYDGNQETIYCNFGLAEFGD